MASTAMGSTWRSLSRSSGAQLDRSLITRSRALMMRRFRLIPSAFARWSTDFSRAAGRWTVVGMNIFPNIPCLLPRERRALHPQLTRRARLRMCRVDHEQNVVDGGRGRMNGAHAGNRRRLVESDGVFPAGLVQIDRALPSFCTAERLELSLDARRPIGSGREGDPI